MRLRRTVLTGTNLVFGSLVTSVLLLFLFARPGIAAEGAPIVAIFEVQDMRSKESLSKHVRDQMTAYLSARIAESGSYRVVPQGQILDALRKQKKGSYEHCIDEACQIELGRAVAAEK